MSELEDMLKQIYEKLEHLESKLGDRFLPDQALNAKTPMLNWTLSKTDLIELVYALHSGGAFNRGTATIADIARFFEEVLHIQLGNTSMTFQEILRRKDSTAFLERLKEKLEEHIDHIEEKNIRKQ